MPGPSTIWIYPVVPRELHYLQFVLEAYEGVVTLTTLEARTGRLQVPVPPGAQAAAQSLMAALGGERGPVRLGREEDRW